MLLVGVDLRQADSLVGQGMSREVVGDLLLHGAVRARQALEELPHKLRARPTSR